MRQFILVLVLCIIFFILPLQCFTIGDSVGIGIQGALYRYQVTTYGDSFIPLSRELTYVLNETYTGKAAWSIIIWIGGSLLLAISTILSLINIGNNNARTIRWTIYILMGSCGCYLASCIARYGFLLNSPSGISIPIGILLILIWSFIALRYNVFLSNS